MTGCKCPVSLVAADDDKFTPSQLREFISAQVCPWCSCGPFRVLAVHLTKKHGLSPRAFRVLAGLLSTATICAPEHSEACADRPQMLVPPVHRAGEGKPREWTPVGRAAAVAHGLALSKMFPPAANPLMSQAKPRGLCVVCGAQIPASRTEPSAVTCSSDCLTKRKAQLMSDWRRGRSDTP
jgi:predicted nucleic acid-binding Zn ribbon protein